MNKKKIKILPLDPDHSIFSYSQLTTFKNCKEQYKIIYIDGIKKKDESIEAFMGKCVHKTLEWLYNKDNMKKPYITFDKICETYDNIWQNSWHEKIFIVDNNLISDNYYSTGKRCLANYYHKYGPSFDQRVYATELALDFNIDGKYKFRGVIDRLDQIRKNNAKKDLQLALYHIAIEQNISPVKNISLNRHFLRNGVEMTIRHTPDEIIKFKKSLIKKVKNIISTSQSLENFYPKESILCNWCYLWDECSVKLHSNPAKNANKE